MRFSIIIPAHNEEKNIRKALESVKSQEFKDYEVIVVCDSCTDNTEAIAREYGARVYVTDVHRDSLARNIGLDHARGEWVLFMDADDWYLHEYVLSQLDAKVGKENEDVLLFTLIWKHIGYCPVRSLHGTIFTHVANKCWRRSSIGDCRFPNVKPGSDAAFWNNMVERKIKIVEWDMPLYYYNYLRKGSISDEAGRTVDGTKAYWSVR